MGHAPGEEPPAVVGVSPGRHVERQPHPEADGAAPATAPDDDGPSFGCWRPVPCQRFDGRARAGERVGLSPGCWSQRSLQCAVSLGSMRARSSAPARTVAGGRPMSMTTTEAAWPMVAPGEAGFAPDLGERFEAAREAGVLPNLHGVVAVRHGRVFFERHLAGTDSARGRPLGVVRFGPDTLHDLRSATKSVVGLLYGSALAAGCAPAPHAKPLERFPERPDPADPARKPRASRPRHPAVRAGAERGGGMVSGCHHPGRPSFFFSLFSSLALERGIHTRHTDLDPLARTGPAGGGSRAPPTTVAGSWPAARPVTPPDAPANGGRPAGAAPGPAAGARNPPPAGT